ncbi:Glycosyltransferase involved in cell wall bisynthesis [Evansella caseinilytica]|uniref:Glycosyltransferase involved in cell wall bisynthesis n=1 Tax=Evansella caseinilytica TaxID=1503961 RepID=A0A1H3TZL5_9BACI|nr:glycosyltransferase [Evansella caseinilytica]SDZ55643.1 Glycosyltransferase involved in cell wall bisynthesis [Evansella caseinilytica]
MSSNKTVVHITTVHHPLDPRIYYKECRSLQNAGYDVTLLAPETEESLPDEINIIPLKKYNNRIFRMLFSTAAAYLKARKLKADYYHFHDPELLLVAWLLKSKKNVVIYDIHEDYETGILQKEYLPKPFRKLLAKAYQTIETALSKKMELCLAEKYYKDKYRRGQCILNYPLLNKKLIDYRSESEPPENKLIYTGNISVDRGAKKHAKVPKLDNNVTVYLVGKCPEGLAETMGEIAGEHKQRLIIEGIGKYVPKEIIDQYYTSHRWIAGMAIFPPTDHYMKKELTKFFEYMSLGIPIICSDFPVWKKFVDKYTCGITVNPDNEDEIKRAIAFLRSNQDAAKKMGNNGKEAVINELNWNKEEEKLIKWYSDIGRQ